MVTLVFASCSFLSFSPVLFFIPFLLFQFFLLIIIITITITISPLFLYTCTA